MPNRQMVYAAIDSERDYQEQRWERPQHNHTNTEYLVYIDRYVKQAFAAVSVQDGEAATFPALRKIAALAVAAMEQNGVEFRTKDPFKTPVKVPRISLEFEPGGPAIEGHEIAVVNSITPEHESDCRCETCRIHS